MSIPPAANDDASDSDATSIWPAWLFSAAIHATGFLVAATWSAAALMRGGDSLAQQPWGVDLQLSLSQIATADPADESLGAGVDAPTPTPVIEVAPPLEPIAETPATATDEPTATTAAGDRSDDPDDAPPKPSILGLEKLLPAEALGHGASGAHGDDRAGGSRGRLQLGKLAGRATVRVFGVEGTGTNFVYLFDRSTSMAGAPLAAAQAQLIGSLDALQSTNQFHVIFFNHRLSTWGGPGGGRIALASERNKELAAGFVRSIAATGGTERRLALHEALRYAPDVIFFLTDADDTMTDTDVAEIAERARGRDTMIACIEFGRGPAAGRQNFLTELAAAAGGQYAYVDVLTLSD